MKKYSILFVFAFVLVNTIFAQSYTADINNSTLQWTGEKVTGEHSGNVSLQSGAFIIENNIIQSGEFTIDMSSITCTDIENAEYNAKLVGHLKSGDFFGTSKFPTAQFVVTEKSEIKGGKATIKGNLTIKEKTQPIEFRAVISQSNLAISVFGNVVVDRSKFDVRYGSGSFFDNLGDKTIYDEFQIKLNIVGSKNTSR